MYLEELARQKGIQQALERLQASAMGERANLTQRINELTEQLKEQRSKLEERVRTIDQVADNYIRLRYSTRNLRRRVDHFTHLPIGYHARKRKDQAERVDGQQTG